MKMFLLVFVVFFMICVHPEADRTSSIKGLGFCAQTTTCSSDTPRQFPLWGDPAFALTTLDGWQSALGKLRVEGVWGLDLRGLDEMLLKRWPICLIFPLDLVNHYRNHLTQGFGVSNKRVWEIPYCSERSRKPQGSNGPKNGGFSTGKLFISSVQAHIGKVVRFPITIFLPIGFWAYWLLRFAQSQWPSISSIDSQLESRMRSLHAEGKFEEIRICRGSPPWGRQTLEMWGVSWGRRWGSWGFPTFPPWGCLLNIFEVLD